MMNKFIKDILNMCMKRFATGKKNVFDKMFATFTLPFISICKSICIGLQG